MVDLDDIVALSQRINGISLSLAQAERACDQQDHGYAMMLITVSEVLAGFIAYACVLDEVTILASAVAEESRGKGLGCTLLGEALHEMRSRGFARCLLEVRASNAAARNLYLSHGFTQDGVRKNYYVSGLQREDAVLMSIDLQVAQE